MEVDERIDAEVSSSEEMDVSTDNSSEEVQGAENNVGDATESKTLRFSEKHPTATKILQGLGVAAIAGGFLALVNYLSRDESNDCSAVTQSYNDPQLSFSDLVEEEDKSSSSTENTYISQEDVAPHRRNLPKGQHASEAKVKQAEAEGDPLKPGQTSVNGYPRERTIHKK